MKAEVNTEECEQAATAERVRRAMLANLRHELRTPINAITNYSEILLEDVAEWEDADSLRRDLGKIYHAGQDLLTVVNRILDPARIEAELDVDWETFGMQLRHELLTPVSAIVGYCEIWLEEATPEQQEVLRPDLQRIHTAALRFLALLGDVVNFARIESGELTSSLTTTDLAEVVTSIRPLDALEDKLSPTNYGPVLVVDDNEFNRDLLARRLLREGHYVRVASGGQEALAMVHAESFDLVLLDVMMPEMNGYQVLQQLKADANLREIPVIMISALDELDSVVRCLETGAEDYLPKPFEPVILRARVNACLEKKRLRNQEIEYLQNVARISDAAAAVEAETFTPESLSEVAARPDELGRLARVFQRMAQEVYAREQRLKQQVQQLRIEIDEVKKAKQVAEITETDYFQQLQLKARGLRKRQE